MAAPVFGEFPDAVKFNEEYLNTLRQTLLDPGYLLNDLLKIIEAYAHCICLKIPPNILDFGHKDTHHTYDSACEKKTSFGSFMWVCGNADAASNIPCIPGNYNIVKMPLYTLLIHDTYRPSLGDKVMTAECSAGLGSRMVWALVSQAKNKKLLVSGLPEHSRPPGAFFDAGIEGKGAITAVTNKKGHAFACFLHYR
jgi:hypothetical protein